MANWLSVMFIVSAFFFQFQFGASQRLITKVGPHNITRTEGELNVYIPCPFPGSASPIWLINGILYEAFNLPENMVSVSFGLLITVVTVEMDGKTFQCMVPTGVAYNYHKSRIGTLTVEKDQSGLDDEGIIHFPSTTQFSLDHQRTVFEKGIKTLSWTRAVDSCDAYEMNSTLCSGARINDSDRNWDSNAIQGTSIPISSEYIMYNNNSVYFRLSAVNKNTRAMCQTLIADIAIQSNDNTQQHKVSFNDFCVVVESTMSPYIVLPSKSGGNDCPCLITIRESYICSCIGDTIYHDSLVAYEHNIQHKSFYNVCFVNLTQEMNNTRIHFYELFRICVNKQHMHTHPYYNYFQSFQILIVLPDPPEVTVDSLTGQINFSSPHRDGIELDYYQVIITDVTNQSVINTTKYNNNISVGDMFQQSICSPYIVTVEAHNTIGATESIIPVKNNETSGHDDGSNLCSCVNQNVNAEIDLMKDDNSGISVQVNCSHTYDQSAVYLNITVINHGVLMNSSIILCEDESNIPFDFLKCDTSYTLMVSWITMSENDTSESECKLNHQQNKMIACSTPNRSNPLSIPYIIAIVFGLLFLLSLIANIIIVIVVLCKRVHCKKVNLKSTQGDGDTTNK